MAGMEIAVNTQSALHAQYEGLAGMPGFFRVSVCAIFIGACLLAGKANASDSEALPGFNIEGAFCGIGHTNAKTAEITPQIVETETPAPTGPLLAQSTLKGLMKCHSDISLKDDGAGNHPCHQMKCCDTTSPGDSALGGSLSWAYVMQTGRCDNYQPASIAFGSNTVTPLSRPDAPELRPPASITV